MKTCKQCGFHNIDTERRCVRCGSWLAERVEPDPLAPVERDVFDFVPGQREGWHWEVPGRLAGALRRRWFILCERLRSPLPPDVHRRNPWLAGALALVPGAGQLYNHQPRKALYFGVALAAWMVLLVLTFYRPVSHWIGYGYALMATWAFHDGFMTARRINRCEDYWVRRMGFFSAWILYVCIAYLIWHALLASDFIVTIRRVNDASMAPTLCAGERVLINNVGCWFFRPRVGELVVYHPPPMQLRILESTLVIREYGAMTADSTVEQPQAIGRIVAGPGQVFERVGGQFLVDGHPIELDPWLARLNLPSKFRLEAPKGSYIIPCDYGGKGWASSSIVDKAPLKFWDALGKPIDMKKEWVLRNWAEVCTVKRGWIKGVVSLVYDPPPVRRLLRPVSFASEGLPGADAEEAGH